jgi:hypothetical protein
MIRSILIPILALGLLTGCATTNLPPLTAGNPASPAAPEAVTRPARYSLGPDSETKRTGRLIAERAKQDSSTQPQREKKNQSMPDMQNMPGMQNDH